jgi:hypothetical protein
LEWDGASPGKSRKSDFVPQRRGSHTSNRSKVSVSVTFFDQIKKQRDLFLKMVLRLT